MKVGDSHSEVPTQQSGCCGYDWEGNLSGLNKQGGYKQFAINMLVWHHLVKGAMSQMDVSRTRARLEVPIVSSGCMQSLLWFRPLLVC